MRRAGRTAMRTRGELIGAHVAADDGLVGVTASALEAQRSLLEQLGGRYVEVVGADVAQALVQVARAENATQLILGASRRSRWHELVQGSVINSVVHAAGGSIDVHVISTTNRGDGETPPAAPRRQARLAAVPRRRQAVSLGVGLVGVVVLTLVMTHFRSSLGLQNAALLYLLFVLGVATIGGTVPAMLTAVAAFLALNWFFTPPYHTLHHRQRPRPAHARHVPHGRPEWSARWSTRRHDAARTRTRRAPRRRPSRRWRPWCCASPTRCPRSPRR